MRQSPGHFAAGLLSLLPTEPGPEAQAAVLRFTDWLLTIEAALTRRQ